jgi:hypothetical protein
MLDIDKLHPVRGSVAAWRKRKRSVTSAFSRLIGAGTLL